ncbi:hypothetical protein G6L37_07110 [Agrobacterium rubi]|nr:hypothetical protein [Agrobacterium rubi]NTF25135.1 hypothetical protein [Agrobacterium rubi]
MHLDHSDIMDIRRKLEQPSVPDRLFSAKDGSRVFMELVTDAVVADKLIADLADQNTNSEWGYREWIEQALLYPGFAVSCRSDDGRAVGFLSFDTLVFIHDLGRQALSISVKLQPESVYVTEGDRGRGVGGLFTDVVAHQLHEVLARLAALSTGGLNGVSVREVSVGIEAECVSEEGTRFARTVFAACEKALASHDKVGDWPLSETLNDFIDYGDFEDEDEAVAAFT